MLEPGRNDGKLGFLSGMKQALPIVMGYVPVSFAFGVLASDVGMTSLDALIMGALFFAGSGQLIAVQMLGNGDGALAIVMVTTIVNLRHLLMSAAMTTPLQRWSRLRKAIFAFELTDETFALHANRFANLPDVQNTMTKRFYVAQTFGINVTAHASWISGGFLGAAFGSLLGDLEAFGLDYALPAMFVALLAPRLKIKPQLIVAIVAGVSSVLFVLGGMGQWNIILASILAATVGLFLPKALQTTTVKAAVADEPASLNHASKDKDI